MKTKTKMIALVLTSMTILSIAMLPAISAKTTSLEVSYNQAQFQWRASAAEIGDWTYSYTEYETLSDFKLTGNVLHMDWEYSPDVEDLEGQSTVYVYNKKADLWIEKEGQVSYKYEPGYGDYQIVNFYRGYMEFNGEPSEESFVHGVAYQWVYLIAPEDADTALLPPYAEWDEKVGMWLVGFSIYLWDPTAPETPYDIEFPDPFIEPVPANNYNPLEL